MKHLLGEEGWAETSGDVNSICLVLILFPASQAAQKPDEAENNITYGKVLNIGFSCHHRRKDPNLLEEQPLCVCISPSSQKPLGRCRVVLYFTGTETKAKAD